jgi:hypothetical protein
MEDPAARAGLTSAPGHATPDDSIKVTGMPYAGPVLARPGRYEAGAAL